VLGRGSEQKGKQRKGKKSGGKETRDRRGIEPRVGAFVSLAVVGIDTPE